jgi:hydrogenase maturation protease
MATRVKIIGIGSPFGDDRLGWMAAQVLQSSVGTQSAAGQIEITALDRPGAALISEWNGADAVILIDAVRSGATPGTLHCLAPDRLDTGITVTSSHGLGIAAALELAQTLDELPDKLCLCGIEIDPSHTGENLSPSVQAALPSLVSQVEQLTGELFESVVMAPDVT